MVASGDGAAQKFMMGTGGYLAPDLLRGCGGEEEDVAQPSS